MLRLVRMCACLVLAWACLALPARASDQDAARQFDIPSQPLDAALLLFSSQAGLQLVALGDLEGRWLRQPLRGRYTPRQALAAMLRGTGMVAAFDDGMVTVRTLPALATQAERRPPPLQVQELDEVTVTARRRDERLLDVPIAVTLVDGVRMAGTGMRNVAAALETVPVASVVDHGQGFTSVQIRGVSSSLGGNDNGYYLDEIPFSGVTVPWYPDAHAFDLERVEVIKGPQGTLFGEGSMGGTVRIATRAPQPGVFAAEAAAAGYATRHGGLGAAAKAMVNVPLGADAALRVVVTDESLPGWLRDGDAADEDRNRQHKRSGRLRMRLQPAERLQLDLAHWTYRNEAPHGGYGATDAGGADFYYGVTADWRLSSAVARLELDHSRLEFTAARADLSHRFDGEIAPQTRYLGSIGIGIASQELRWTSAGEGPLRWVAGYFLRDASRRDHITLGSGGPSHSRQDNHAHAMYGEATWTLPAPAWSLTAGLRRFVDDVDADSNTSAADTTLDARFDSWNPRVALAFKPQADATVYASIARGFRSGQLQPATSVAAAALADVELPLAIRPDTIITYELGGKWLHPGGRLLLEGALFHSDWHDVAVRVPITDTWNGLVNAEGVDIDGVELSASWSPSSALQLQLGAGLIDAGYSAAVPGTAITADAPVYNVPRATLSALLDYRWPVGAAWQGTMHVGAWHTSRRSTGLLRPASGDPITSLSLRLGLEAPYGWSAYLWSENVGNEDGAVDPPSIYGVASRLRPRTTGVELRFAY